MSASDARVASAGIPFAEGQPLHMLNARPGLRNTTSVEVLLNTLEHERHAREALLVAFLDELREAVTDRAPESTRDLLARAESGEMKDDEFQVLLDELRAVVRAAA